MSKIGRLREIYRQKGLLNALVTVVWYLHTRLRHFFPNSGVNEYNDYDVRNAKPLDGFNPNISTDLPAYEEILIEGIDWTAKRGDTVVVVGGGYGVSSVAAADRVGPDASVYTFEGAREYRDIVSETAETNGYGDAVTPIHAVVGEAIELRGEMRGADEIPPRYLPQCDLMVLDAEGAECEILREMRVRPTNIVVETHGSLGCGTETVRSILEERGYDVESLGPSMQSRGEEKMRELDSYILIGRHR